MSRDNRHAESLDGLYEIESGLIARIKALQADPNSSIADIERLLKSLKTVSDQIITKEWVASLKDAIQSNHPGLALPPSVGQGSTARKLVNLRTQEEKQGKRDQRRGENKPSHWVPPSPPGPPPDDAGFSLPGGSRPTCGDGVILPACDSHPPGTPHPKGR